MSILTKGVLPVAKRNRIIINMGIIIISFGIII